MSTVTVKHGVEGPHHDPYSYDEIKVFNHRGWIMIHLGLLEYVEFQLNTPGAQKVRIEHRGVDTLYSVFEAFTGMTADRAAKVPLDLQSRKYREHSAHGEPVVMRGYPGETLTVCGGCGEVLDYDFNESAII